MAAGTTIVMMGMAVAAGASAYSSSGQQEKRADAQAEIAGKQGDLELRRSSQRAEEAMRELEDAREYQQWKEDYVLPVLDASIKDSKQSDPAQLRAKANLARGIQVETAQEQIMGGIASGGFDLGGARHGAADAEMSGARAGAEIATMGAAHEAVKQQGISNTGELIGTGRQVYKQQGII